MAKKKVAKSQLRQNVEDNMHFSEVHHCLRRAISSRKEAGQHCAEIKNKDLRKKAKEVISDYDIGVME